MSSLQMFIPLTKVDAAQRLVYGVATAEVEDRSGEVCDYASTKPFYERWSSDIAKSTDGKSLGNVRAMHGKTAAGKVTALTFNDAARQIEVCAKIVDEAEWAKVVEGVYTGFSQGGAYVKRWSDPAGKQRYTADPSEISLVDLPCLTQATFQIIKADGAREQRAFKASAQTPVASEEWEQVWKSKRDGATFRSKAELRKYHEDLDAQDVAKAAAGPALDTLKTIRETLGTQEHEVLDKTAVNGELAKVTAERDALQKALAALQPQLEEILNRVKNIEEQPLPLPFSGQRRAVSKGQDTASGLHVPDISDSAEATRFMDANRDALMIEFIKMAQRQPHSSLAAR